MNRFRSINDRSCVRHDRRSESVMLDSTVSSQLQTQARTSKLRRSVLQPERSSSDTAWACRTTRNWHSCWEVRKLLVQKTALLGHCRWRRFSLSTDCQYSLPRPAAKVRRSTCTKGVLALKWCAGVISLFWGTPDTIIPDKHQGKFGERKATADELFATCTSHGRVQLVSGRFPWSVDERTHRCRKYWVREWSVGDRSSTATTTQRALVSGGDMLKAHRDALRKSRIALIQDLQAANIANYLIPCNLLTEREFEEIKAAKTNQEKTELILSYIPRKGSQAFDQFVAVLNEVPGQQHLAQKLLAAAQTTRANCECSRDKGCRLQCWIPSLCSAGHSGRFPLSN